MSRYRKGAGGLLLVLALMFALGTPGAAADRKEQPDLAGQVEELKQLLHELRDLSEQQVRELQQRIAELEAQLAQIEAEQEQDELEALRAEAEELTAGEARKEEETAEARRSFTGGQRTLQKLNPEISFLGDVSYDWTNGPMKDGFLLRGVELGFQAPLDPYTRFKAFLGGHQHPFELELGEEGEEEGHEHSSEVSLGVGEAYMEWVALPTNLRLYVGKFRQQYGTLNRWHIHALPTVESPLALQRLFGTHGLVGLGVGLNWQLPPAWASSNTLTVEVTNADNAQAFAGAHWKDPAFLLRHTGFFELGPSTYFELGLNAVRGANDETGRNHTLVAGTDFNFLWEPVNRARYRNVELRGEWLHSEFEAGPDEKYKTDSFYTYLSFRLSRRWTVGMRYDNTEIPSDRFELYDTDTLEPLDYTEGLREEAITPFVTFWQSPFVRLRLQYQYANRDFLAPWGGDNDHKAWLQVTFAAGPHKHEAY
jgi:hypothetical protein